ncbi:MAG: hypothetical protein AAGI15_08510 [Pseudomonadota bacterium]
MKKLLSFIATIWLVLFVFYPTLATLSGLLVHAFTDSLFWALIVVAAEFLILVLLIASGAVRVTPMTTEENRKHSGLEF